MKSKFIKAIAMVAAMGTSSLASADEVEIIFYEVLHDVGEDLSRVNWVADTKVGLLPKTVYAYDTDDVEAYQATTTGEQTHVGTYTEDDTFQHTLTVNIGAGLGVTATDSHTLAKPSSNTCTIIAGSGLEHIDETEDELVFRTRWFNKDAGACTSKIEREVDMVWQPFASIGGVVNNSTVFKWYGTTVAHDESQKYRCVLDCASVDYIGTTVNFPHPVGGP